MKFFSFIVSLLFSTALFAIPEKVDNAEVINFSKMNFVYLEAQGTIQDTFSEERRTILNYISQYGIVTKRTAIFFLDFYGTDTTFDKNYDKNSKDFAEKLIADGININRYNKFNVTEKFLVDNYGSAYLQINRKVLVGVLLFPNISITPTEDIHTIKFADMQEVGFQSMLPLSENGIPYTIYDRVYDRTSMIQYLNLEYSKYIGMMEIYDEDNQVLTFFGIKGNKEKFIKENNISSLKPGIIVSK